MITCLINVHVMFVFALPLLFTVYTNYINLIQECLSIEREALANVYVLFRPTLVYPVFAPVTLTLTR